LLYLLFLQAQKSNLGALACANNSLDFAARVSECSQRANLIFVGETGGNPVLTRNRKSTKSLIYRGDSPISRNACLNQ
jgi:hypothetical protein